MTFFLSSVDFSVTITTPGLLLPSCVPLRSAELAAILPNFKPSRNKLFTLDSILSLLVSGRLRIIMFREISGCGEGVSSFKLSSFSLRSEMSAATSSLTEIIWASTSFDRHQSFMRIALCVLIDCFLSTIHIYKQSLLSTGPSSSVSLLLVLTVLRPQATTRIVIDCSLLLYFQANLTTFTNKVYVMEYITIYFGQRKVFTSNHDFQL